MNTIYAIYKENILPLVGGVNPQGIEVGLGEYRNWKLCVMAETEFNKYSEFSLYPIPKSIAVGISLNSNAEYTPMQDDVMLPSHATMNVRTPEEDVLVDLAKEYIDKLELKFVTRAKIRQYKDFEDDLSDTKLLVEFLLAYIAEDYASKTQEQKDTLPIKDMMDKFILSLEGKNLRINNEKILNKVSKIIQDESIIARIVKSNYIDQLKLKS